MAGARQHEPERALEMTGDLPDAFGRRDMVLAAGLNVGRCLHLADVDRGAVHRDTARQDEAVLAVEVAQISRSEEHTSELQSLMRNSYAVFCLKKQNRT